MTTTTTTMLRPSLYLPMVVVASTCKEMTLRWRADDFRKEHVLILVSSPFCVSIEMRRRSLSLSLSLSLSSLLVFVLVHTATSRWFVPSSFGSPGGVICPTVMF